MTDQIAGRLTRLIRFFFFGLALMVLGWGWTDYPSVFAGLTLGFVMGFIGTFQLIRRIHQFGQAAATGGRVPNLGTMTRLALAALAAVIAIIYPEYFNLASLLVGLFLPTMFAIGDVLYLQLKQGK